MQQQPNVPQQPQDRVSIFTCADIFEPPPAKAVLHDGSKVSHYVALQQLQSTVSFPGFGENVERELLSVRTLPLAKIFISTVGELFKAPGPFAQGSGYELVARQINETLAEFRAEQGAEGEAAIYLRFVLMWWESRRSSKILEDIAAMPPELVLPALLLDLLDFRQSFKSTGWLM